MRIGYLNRRHQKARFRFRSCRYDPIAATSARYRVEYYLQQSLTRYSDFIARERTLAFGGL